MKAAALLLLTILAILAGAQSIYTRGERAGRAAGTEAGYEEGFKKGARRGFMDGVTLTLLASRIPPAAARPSPSPWPSPAIKDLPAFKQNKL